MSGKPPFSSNELTRFPNVNRNLILLCEQLGWDIRWTSPAKRMVVMRSPIDSNVSVSVVNQTPSPARTKSWVEKVVRYSDHKAIDNLVIGKGIDLMKHPELAPLIGRMGTAMVVDQAVKRTAIEEAFDAALEKNKQAALSPPAEPITVLAEKPWLARMHGKESSGGVMYESLSVIEVTWSDGSVTYKCRAEGCTYQQSPNPRSISSHYAGTHSKSDGKVPKPQPLITDDYKASDIHYAQPSRRLMSDLMFALDSINGWQQLTAEELARQVATKIAENRPEHAPAEPLTPEQVLERIAMLVDRGRLVEMHHNVETLTAQLVEASEAREQAEQRLSVLDGNMRALREMLSEEQ